MARRKRKQDDTISKLEALIFALLEPEQKVGVVPQELTVAERIQLINVATKLTLARHKISGDDDEGSFYQK